MNRQKIACNCKNITYGMIEDAIKAGAESYEDVEKQLRFGTGCGKCREFIRFLVRDILEENGAWTGEKHFDPKVEDANSCKIFINIQGEKQ